MKTSVPVLSAILLAFCVCLHGAAGAPQGGIAPVATLEDLLHAAAVADATTTLSDLDEAQFIGGLLRGLVKIGGKVIPKIGGGLLQGALGGGRNQDQEMLELAEAIKWGKVLKGAGKLGASVAPGLLSGILGGVAQRIGGGQQEYLLSEEFKFPTRSILKGVGKAGAGILGSVGGSLLERAIAG